MSRRSALPCSDSSCTLYANNVVYLLSGVSGVMGPSDRGTVSASRPQSHSAAVDRPGSIDNTKKTRLVGVNGATDLTSTTESTSISGDFGSSGPFDGTMSTGSVAVASLTRPIGLAEAMGLAESNATDKVTDSLPGLIVELPGNTHSNATLRALTSVAPAAGSGATGMTGVAAMMEFSACGVTQVVGSNGPFSGIGYPMSVGTASVTGLAEATDQAESNEKDSASGTYGSDSLQGLVELPENTRSNVTQGVLGFVASTTGFGVTGVARTGSDQNPPGVMKSSSSGGTQYAGVYNCIYLLQAVASKANYKASRQCIA